MLVPKMGPLVHESTGQFPFLLLATNRTVRRGYEIVWETGQPWAWDLAWLRLQPKSAPRCRVPRPPGRLIVKHPQSAWPHLCDGIFLFFFVTFSNQNRNNF